MLANNKNAIAEREPLGWVGGYRHIKRGVSDGDAGRSGDYPADVLVVPVPHLDSERQVGRDVVQVWVCKFAQKLVHPLMQSARFAQSSVDCARSCSRRLRVWSWPSARVRHTEQIENTMWRVNAGGCPFLGYGTTARGQNGRQQ